MSEVIPLSVPSIRGNEWKYIKECLDTEWVSSAGKFVDLFERNISTYTKSKYAIACINGTTALHISLILTGINPGDQVIVPTLTFISPINVVRYLKADPLFMDCDEYYNINVYKVIDFIKKETIYKNGVTINRVTGQKIPAIILVHIFGNAVFLNDLMVICKERNITIIEDATESLGTIYTEGGFAGKHTGTIGDMGCLSFNGNKIITSGGGGMILTNNKAYAEKALYLTNQAKDDEINYIHNEIGYNYRLSNMHAALGVGQLEQLPKYLKLKKKNFNYYKSAIDNIPGLHIAETPPFADNNHWMYALQIDEEVYGQNRDRLINYLKNYNIQARPVWYLNHLQKPFKNYQSFQIEKAYDLYDRTINIPCSVNITTEDINKVIEYLANG